MPLKLFRRGPLGAEKPGLIDASGGLRDLSGVVADVTPSTLALDSMTKLAVLDPTTLPLLPEGRRLGACVGGVGNVVCIGLNYADHAAEAGMEPPTQPIVFSKHNGAISGPFDDIWLAPGSQKLDWAMFRTLICGWTSTASVDRRAIPAP